MKACWLSEHAFLCLATLHEAASRAACPSKSPSPQFNKWRNSSQIHTCMFPAYSPIHHNIRRSESLLSFPRVSQKVHRCLLFYWYSCTPKNIKKDIPDKVVPIFEAWKLSAMHDVLPKVIQARLTTNKTNFVNRKYSLNLDLE
jgi:hypothetical protein